MLIYRLKETGSYYNVSENTVILIDGWKNTPNNRNNVVCMLHNADGTKKFLEAYDLTSTSALAEIIKKTSLLAKERYNTNVYAVLSENVSNIVKTEKCVGIWHATCNSHTANLLLMDIIKHEIVQNVNIIIKEFKQPANEQQILKLNGTRLITPCETRWCSYRDAFASVTENIRNMRVIAGNTKTKIKQNVTQLLYDEEFLQSINSCIELITPICELVNICQKTESSIADAANLWLKLKLPLKYEEEFRNNSKIALNKYALAAFYLHPLYKSSALSSAQLDEVEDFLIDELDATGLNDLAQFKQNIGIFKKLNEKGVTVPTTFWNMAERKHPELAKLAQKLLNVPASTAQLKQLCSNFSFVHSPLRNKLCFERSKKLIEIYNMLKISDENNSSSY